jgi:hypothetical protein
MSYMDKIVNFNIQEFYWKLESLNLIIIKILVEIPSNPKILYKWTEKKILFIAQKNPLGLQVTKSPHVLKPSYSRPFSSTLKMMKNKLKNFYHVL